MPTTRASADALKALKEEVLRKHGKLRGVLHEETDAAIWAHVEMLQEERFKKEELEG